MFESILMSLLIILVMIIFPFEKETKIWAYGLSISFVFFVLVSNMFMANI